MTTNTTKRIAMRSSAVAAVLLTLSTIACDERGPKPNVEACQHHEEGWCGPGKYCLVLPDRSGSRCEDIKTDAGTDASLDQRSDSMPGDTRETSMIPVEVGPGVDGAGDGGTDLQIGPPVTDGGGDTNPPPTDMGTTCTNECTPVGKTECTTGGVRTCTMMPSGCTSWGAPQQCPAPQMCPTGQTQCSCPTGSTACSKQGDQKCGAGGLQTCQANGACFSWGDAQACTSPQICSGSAPNARCQCPTTNACTTEGAPKCGTGGGVQTCTKDAAGCLTWSAEKACSKAGERCMGTACVDVTCPRQSSANLVQNAGFDTSVWPMADKDRGFGPRLPRWSSDDSTPMCSASGSMVVTDRTAFSPPIPIGPPGTRYYWGFRAKLSRAGGGPFCELHYCTDESCLLFLTRDQINVTSTDWQPSVSPGTTVPTPDPPQPLPYVQIACFGYAEPNGPEVYYDRFFFSSQPISF